MKRTISLLLVCLLLLVALPVSAEADSLAGTWVLSSLEAEGLAVAPAELGLEMTITLQEDGSAEMAMPGVSTETGSWTVDGESLSITDSAGTPQVFTVSENGTLSTDANGAVMIFVREGAELPAVESEALPAVLEEVTLADFDGEWTATHGMAMGVEVSLEMLGMQMDMSISDGSVTVSDSTSSQVMEAVLDGNALVVDMSGVEVPLYLRDDGTLAMSMNLGSYTMDIIFARV